jgi:hypothetical protein
VIAVNHTFGVNTNLLSPSINFNNELLRINNINDSPFTGFGLFYNYHIIPISIYFGASWNLNTFESNNYTVNSKNYRQDLELFDIHLHMGYRYSLVNFLDLFAEVNGGYIEYNSKISERSAEIVRTGRRTGYKYDKIQGDDAGTFEYALGIGMVIKTRLPKLTTIGLIIGYELHFGKSLEMIYYRQDKEKIYTTERFAFPSDYSLFKIGLEIGFLGLKN